MCEHHWDINDLHDLHDIKMVVKWSKNLSELKTFICTSMLELHCSLSPIEEKKLIEYTVAYKQLRACTGEYLIILEK